MTTPPATVRALRESGWRETSTKDEMRRNLLGMIRNGEERFPGIHGYERTVIPAVENAILARHDMILLGLRGQAKTRILRALSRFLDDSLPIIAGCDINDSPYRPVCKRCRKLAETSGDDLPVEWIGRSRRYREKLATPDVTVADLIGDIDPVKAANLRLEYSDEEVIHYGIIPRTNRGIFAINELPDLAPRIQVALLNILEERDLQIRGFPVRIPMDIMLVFSANPEDYTSRGNIITPLKDRIDSQVLTHYPRDVSTARRITDQESWLKREGSPIEIPGMVRDLIERIAFHARESDLVDQSSGVSARMPISAIELLMSNLERRGATTGDSVLYPRLSDLLMLVPAITGKVEMVYEGEQQGAEVVAQHLVGAAVLELFESVFPPVERGGAAQRRRRAALQDDEEMDSMFRRVGRQEEPEEETTSDSVWTDVLSWFAAGNSLTVSDEMAFDQYYGELNKVQGLEQIVVERCDPDSRPEEKAFLMELALEGLHQSLRLAREDIDSTITFSELAKFNVLRTVR